ncbi:MAG: AAA family ATPase [Thiomargarita sp.]|nr:AAA family ATPase [Thiomargarita sp.]
MQIKIPELSLILLVGVSSSGKSTFAKKYFKPTEILSSDHCRALISDDENDQSITKEAFEILHFIAAKRLAAGKLTVIDATNVQTEARKSLFVLARKYHISPVVIIFNLPEALCLERNQQRPDRHFGSYVIQQQYANLKQTLYHIKQERVKRITIIDSVEKIDAIEIKRVPLSSNRKYERGPFDIIGDVHGCFDELIELLEQLGYLINGDLTHYTVTHPKGRKAIFVGDLVDRGPKSPQVLRLVMDMVAEGTAFCVSGNHDVKLKRKLKGKNVKLTHGLANSVQQLESFPLAFHQEVLNFIEKLVSHYLFDNGKLVVAHAGMKEELQGRTSGKVREFALYGDTTGELDEFGLPVRLNWAADYRGKAIVVYGHTSVPEAEWLNNTICVDTGCVFGGKLTAFRYPEKELVSVPAKYTYYKSIKPFISEDKLAPSLNLSGLELRI